MSRRRRIVLTALALGGAIVVGGTLWIRTAAQARLQRTYETHRVEIPVPYPESGTAATSLARAIARGRHLVEARYGCVVCHGVDFGGGTMLDDPALGTWQAPNLTTGPGSRTRGYGMADWDRIVRHGVKPDGTPAVMPSEDYVQMSDQELADIVVYIRSLPPVDRAVPRPTFGPLGLVLMALGKLPLSAEAHAATLEHPARPPAAMATVAFGRHLVQTCTGCHRADLRGGPIRIGPPDWPPAANLTPHPEGLADWTYEQFATTMRTGQRPDGRKLRFPMTDMVEAARHMTETELQALWACLRSLPPKPTGQ